MKKAILATTAILLATTAGANAQETWPRWYIGLGGGVTLQNDSDVSGVGGVTEFEYDNGYSASAALGYRLQPHESLLGNGNIELEVSTRQQDLDGSTGDVTADVIALNYIEHLGQGSGMTPYVGVGVGSANIEVDGIPTAGDDNVFIYQVMGGVGYQPETMPRTRLKVGYRYLGTFSDPTVSTGDFEYDNHAVEVGAEFQF